MVVPPQHGVDDAIRSHHADVGAIRDVQGARGGHCKTWWSETEVKCDVWELLDDIASLSRRLIRCRETRKMTYKSFKEVNCHVREPEKEMARPVRMP